MNVILQILKAGNLALTLEPLALELAVKLKALFHLQPDISVNITTLAGEAVSADDEAAADVAEWKKTHGLN